MGAKQLTYADEARQKLLAGVSKLARAVRSTLGPRGRNAVIDKGWGRPTVTKDGVTVAEEIELSDPYEDMGAKLVKEAASKTSDVAGDGTTTATILAEAIYREGLKMIAAGHDPSLVYDILNRVESPANEFKRRQLPPTLIISRNAIGIGRRRPVTHRYRRQPKHEKVGAS